MVSSVIPGGYLMSTACLAIWLFGYSAIHKELLVLITPLHHLYDTTGDAEAFGLALVLSSFCGVASIASIVKDTWPTNKAEVLHAEASSWFEQATSDTWQYRERAEIAQGRWSRLVFRSNIYS